MTLDPNSDAQGRVTHSLVGEAPFSVRSLSLEVQSGNAKGTTHRASAEVIQIGSHPRCDLVIDDPTVSRFHCEIVVGTDRARVIDSGSRNGTTVDGTTVIEAPLKHGSRLAVGRTEVLVSFGIENTAIDVSEQSSFGKMFGAGAGMRALFARLEKAAASDATVVLEGETGTGKTMAARNIHAASGRATGPFVVVDCGAISPNLLESELFGHERGAFTGAEERRIGALEEANGGTLFLDEIGELPLNLQPKLLGSLEGRVIRRLGSSKDIAIDVRVIAATNRNLREEVNSGGFRSDLYFRLAVIDIRLPPLRERADDIPPLARQLLLGLGAPAEKVDVLLDGEQLTRLARGAWPGNVRELRNYLERCLVLDELSPVPAFGEDGTGGSSAAAAGSYVHLPFADAKKRATDDFERRYLASLLQTHNRVADAAAAAQIDRTYFYRLLRRHKIKV